MLSAKTTAGICQLQALSVSGRCRTFDARWGAGCGLSHTISPPPAIMTPQGFFGFEVG